ncbi:hypothetical protein J5J83_03070 [Azoarcus sp. L1K30]|uniref:hypothetical protein n=1 Tax=Azoarcus sp. L1K30 TaxID=2820277 RepID=UPI001B839DC7|nr:hypothetical protein [Azoarcus sp. L1K30]MBR0565097.1 hypothetical protein [Azoarcus sp. L1K30]
MNDMSGGTEKQSLLSAGKDLVSLLRDTLLLSLGILLIIFPATFNSILVGAGFEEGSVVGFKWKSRLVEADQALKDARASIADLTIQNAKLSEALVEAQKKINDPSDKERLAKLQEENSRLQVTSEKIEASVQATITSNASLVEKAQLSIGETSQWGVVYGGDTTLSAAQFETGTIARKLGLANVGIYLRQGSYRSVALASSRAEAEQLLYSARTRRGDAYIVDMARWCPRQVQRPDHHECLNP